MPIELNFIQDRFRGLILGTALGDSLGLPFEGLTRNRVRNWGDGVLRQRLLGNYGMVSDDTDHCYFVTQALNSCENLSDFSQKLSRHLRWWLLSLPAGVGFATLRSICRLWLGFKAGGVFSAGNGPAMRSPMIGAFFFDLEEKRDEFVRASTLLTHTDPKAVWGAKAVADLSAWVIRENPQERPSPEVFLGIFDSEFLPDMFPKMKMAMEKMIPVVDFAETIGLGKGISGYILHTVPMVIYAWYRHFRDFPGTIDSLIECGGDTDTTAAIAGALVGATIGEAELPQELIRNIIEFPRTVSVLKASADKLAHAKAGLESSITDSYFWPASLPRNLFFLSIVLFHGFRRIFPPY